MRAPRSAWWRRRRRSARCATPTAPRWSASWMASHASRPSSRRASSRRSRPLPSPGIVVAAMRNAHYDLRERLPVRRRRRAGAGVRLHRRTRAGIAGRLPRSGDGTAHDFCRPPLPTSSPGSSAPSRRSTVRWHRAPGTRAHARLLGQLRGAARVRRAAGGHPADLYRARVGALVLSMANPRHAHEHRCFTATRCPMACCWSRG